MEHTPAVRRAAPAPFASAKVEAAKRWLISDWEGPRNHEDGCFNRHGKRAILIRVTAVTQRGNRRGPTRVCLKLAGRYPLLLVTEGLVGVLSSQCRPWHRRAAMTINVSAWFRPLRSASWELAFAQSGHRFPAKDRPAYDQHGFTNEELNRMDRELAGPSDSQRRRISAINREAGRFAKSRTRPRPVRKDGPHPRDRPPRPRAYPRGPERAT